MTTSMIATADTSSLVSEFAGGSQSDVEMMIGIGLVKDSDAVFFQYIGENGEPHALVLPSGKPLSRMQNVALAGISVAEDVGEFKATKLNLFLETSSGRTVLLTSGLGTIWSQCVITGLIAMLDGGDVTCPFNLDTWKGNSKMRPCFAALRVGQTKMSDNDTYEQLREARSADDEAKILQIMRDAVQILSHAINPESVDVAVSSEVAAALAPAEKTVEVPADF